MHKAWPWPMALSQSRTCMEYAMPKALKIMG